MMQELLNLDTQVLIFLNQLGSEKWDALWLYLTHMKSWLPLYSFLVFFLFFRFHWKNVLLIIGLTVLGIVLADQTSNLLKDNVARLRPCNTPDLLPLIRLVKEGCGGKYGFSSAHAANHMFLAIFLGSIIKSKYNWFFISLIIWALSIGYSRIYIGVHYPLDVLTGFFLGGFIGLSLLKLHGKLIQRL